MTKSRIFLGCFIFVTGGILYGMENPVPDSLRDLARLKQNSNPARMEALKQMLQERGISYELQTFQSAESPHGRTEGTNLVVTFGQGAREITVCAHYDAVELKQGEMIDGMVDNGAGVIALVRMAEALKSRKLRHRVRIVFFDMEENGLIGSKAYVEIHKSGIVTAVNLDIVGFGDTLIYGLGNAEGKDLVHKALLMSCAERLMTCMDSENYPTGDDRSFRDADLPVVGIAFIPRLVAHQGWLILNGGENSGLRNGFLPEIFKIIHTPQDTIEKIDPATVDSCFEIVLSTVLRLDAAFQ